MAASGSGLRIAIFNWRDLDHPKAGGAEVYTHTVARGLAQRGHRVSWFVSRPPGAAAWAERDGYHVLRRGSEITCRLHAARWLHVNKHNLDLVIDEVNTLPFFSPLIAPRKSIVFIPQLAREVWLAEAPPVVGILGYWVERGYLRVYRKTPVITISQSSAASLREIGLRGPVQVVEPSIDPAPPGIGPKPLLGRIGYVGRVTPSKRLDHLIRALALARAQIPHASLVIIGTGPAAERARLERLARAQSVADAITFTGWISRAERDSMMASFDVISLVSLREGWGLSISEAGRFGVPSVVYPVAGLVDSTRNGETGLICSSCTPADLARTLARIIKDRELRDRLGRGAKAFADRLTPERLVDSFESAIGHLAHGHPDL